MKLLTILHFVERTELKTKGNKTKYLLTLRFVGRTGSKKKEKEVSEKITMTLLTHNAFCRKNEI